MKDEVKAIEFIAVKDLLFDPQNPRLPLSVINSNDESEVIDWMLQDASILELMGAIGEKGFFPAEPLLVTPHKKIKGKYIVVEGNRRLAAVKLLQTPKLASRRESAIQEIISEAKHKPSRLPVFSYPNRSDILDYLGFRHITGVKEWKPLAKAKYLRDLQKEYKSLPIYKQYTLLAKAIGSKADYVEKLLIGLELFDIIFKNDYFNIQGLKEDTIEFGVYYNALKYSNIVKFLNIPETAKDIPKVLKLSNLKELVEWISKKNSQGVTRLGESRNLKELNLIVAKPKALAAFRSGKSLEESVIYTDEPNEVFSDAILESLNNLNTANSYFHHVSVAKETDIQNLIEINSISKNLQLLAKAKLDDTNEDEFEQIQKSKKKKSKPGHKK